MLNENIKTLRKQKGYSQETLAQELNVVRQTVSKWEKGYSVPDAVMLEKMAELFEVSVGDLLNTPEPAVNFKTELEQITAQLSILNDQYAREMVRKARIRKIKSWVLFPLLAVFILSIVAVFCALFVSCPRENISYGDTSAALIREVDSETYTQAEIRFAIDAVKDYFSNEFSNCVLTEIYYAGDIRSALESELNGCQVLVLLSTFKTGPAGGDGSFNSNFTYEDFSWSLCQDTDGNWRVINYGYA